jgi:ABC-type amino acid transport substrate-binding protein
MLRLARQILDSKLLSVLGWVIGCMVAVAVLMTLLERRRTRSHLAGSWLKSLGESLWWSITTMSTVGYGDRVPVSWRGKLLGGVWMLVAFALMSVLAGVIASDLTVSRFQPTISSVKQLPKVRVAAAKDFAALMDGAAQGLQVRAIPGLVEALEALRRGEVDAVLGDTAVLRYLVRENYALDMIVLPNPIEVEFPCFPLSPRLPREAQDAFNYWIPRIIGSASWQS